MGLGSFWRRLTRQRRPSQPRPLEAEPPEPAASEPEESLLEPGGAAPHDLRLIQFATDDRAASFPEQRRLLEMLEQLARQPEPGEPVNGEEVLALCDRMVEKGDLRQAIDLLGQLSKRLPRQPRLRLRLAELLYQARDLQPALRLLQDLLEEPSCRVRAHFLLGDHHGREAELDRALLHYEAVLALDATVPRVRQRAHDLRSRLDRPLATAAPTLFGGEELGAGSRFLLQRELGRGGSGTVYLALDRQLQRRVAVKALHRRVRERPDARTHLFCEARIATALQDPGIVAIYDLDEQLDLVVMEYCAGGTLAEQLGQGRLATPLALRRLAEVAAVLDRVHRCGVVHRDLKPGNLLSREVTTPGLAPLIITDFGIAHAEAETPGEAAVAGSLVYMAPEQRQGQRPEPPADLYSCGVILLEMLLGHPPLEGPAALAGATLLELGGIWEELRARLPGGLGGELIGLCQELVDPRPQRRLGEAARLGRRAGELATRAAEALERQQVAAELRRRAGPGPQAPAVRRWLQAHLDELES